jgi:hypothetical protein
VKVPSIKATAFQTVADDIQRHLEKGRLSRDRLEAELEASDLVWIDEKLPATAWVPIDSYARSVELLARLEAPGRREAYLVRRGERSAERLSNLGIYSQLDATTENLGIRVGHIIVTVSQAIYNFTHWVFEPREDEGFSIRVEDAAAFPEVSRFATQGFIQYVSRRSSGRDTRVVSQRPSPDLVVYRSTRNL